MLEGRVLDAQSREPIKKARVGLAAGLGMFDRPTSPEGEENRSRILFTVTDADGRFKLEDIRPGIYRLISDRVGFVQGQYSKDTAGRAGQFLELKSGDHLTGLAIYLTRTGVILGRIFDPDGDPVPRASVAVLKARPRGGADSQSPVEYTETNDLGEYRLFELPPGRYFVRAIMRDGRTDVFRSYSGAGEQGTGAEQVAPVYYPGVPDARGAEPIEVRAGQEVRADLTFTVVRTFTIRGRVTPAPADR